MIKKRGIVTVLVLILLISNAMSVFANDTFNEQIGEEQVNPQVEAFIPTAIGDPIVNTFPDFKFAQVVADTVVAGDVNAVLTQDMVDQCKSIDASKSDNLDITGIEVFVNLEYLWLRRNKLKSVPEIIGKLDNLHFLDLDNNQLIDLPEFIGNLSNLNTLNLGYNQLTSVPERIGDLSNLGRLFLNSNQLTSVPERIGNLSNLYYLNLDSNQLTSLPESIGDLSSLQQLNLISNHLTSVPERIGDLSNLHGFEFANNQLTSLPESFVNLKALQIVMTSDNLFPNNYADYLKELGFNLAFPWQSPFDFEAQAKLLIVGTPATIAIEKQQDIDNIDYMSFLGVQDFSGVKEVLPTHQFILENYIDENNQPIDINAYIKDGIVINSGIIKAQVRVVGTGLFPNNSENAITNETITLQLSIPTFQLTFDLQGADAGNISAQSVEVGALAEKVTDPTKEEYTFNGWNTKPDGSGTPWNFSTSIMPANDIILYAQWEKNKATVDPVNQRPVEPIQTGNNTTTTVQTGDNTTKTVQTGDNTNASLYIVLGVLALAGFVIVGIRKSRNKIGCK